MINICVKNLGGSVADYGTYEELYSKKESIFNELIQKMKEEEAKSRQHNSSESDYESERKLTKLTNCTCFPQVV